MDMVTDLRSISERILESLLRGDAEGLMAKLDAARKRVAKVTGQTPKVSRLPGVLNHYICKIDTLGGSRIFDKGTGKRVAVAEGEDGVSIHLILNRPIHFRAQSAG